MQPAHHKPTFIAVGQHRQRLIERVASRYMQAMEFDSPEALKEYLKAHPGADKSKHTVKKHDKEEHGASPGHKKPSLKERLKSISSKAKDFISKAPGEVRKFLTDDKHRSEVLGKAKDFIKKLPEKTYKNAKSAIKHEAKEFGDAVGGIKAVLSGKKMTDHQKHAIKTVAAHAAISVAVAAVSGGLGAGLGGLAAKSAATFSSALGKKIALDAVTNGLGQAVMAEEVAHLGHGLTHMLHNVLAAEGKKGDDQDLMVAYVSKLVQDRLENLDPEMIAEALEEAAEA